MKFPFIESYRERWPVKTMCRVLEVSTSGYYAWRCRPLSARSERDQELGDAIETVFAAHKSRYGSPRIHRELTIAGVCVGRKRVARIMCQRRLRAKAARRWRIATTTTDPSLAVAPNRLNRDFTAEEPGRVWLSDITYIPTRQGWLYLAVVIDLFTRRIVGWSMSTRLTTDIAIDALNMAISQHPPAPGLIHHSDRGCQYASHRYRRRLDEIEALASMSRKGDCLDNAPCESFFGTLKTELVHDADFPLRSIARRDIFEYVEIYYNRKRMHSALGYLSPVDFECANLALQPVH